jgi:hypothetical protein
MSDDLATAWVAIRPDFSGFESELVAGVDADTKGASGTVRVNADLTGVDALLSDPLGRVMNLVVDDASGPEDLRRRVATLATLAASWATALCEGVAAALNERADVLGDALGISPEDRADLRRFDARDVMTRADDAARRGSP